MDLIDFIWMQSWVYNQSLTGWWFQIFFIVNIPIDFNMFHVRHLPNKMCLTSQETKHILFFVSPFQPKSHRQIELQKERIGHRLSFIWSLWIAVWQQTRCTISLQGTFAWVKFFVWCVCCTCNRMELNPFYILGDSILKKTVICLYTQYIYIYIIRVCIFIYIYIYIHMYVYIYTHK